MPGTALVRLPDSLLWELRAAWGSGRRVAVSLGPPLDGVRLEGFVTRVAATGAFVRIASRQVPVDAVLAVHLPSRLGDSTARAGSFHGRRREEPQSERLW